MMKTIHLILSEKDKDEELIIEVIYVRKNKTDFRDDILGFKPKAFDNEKDLTAFMGRKVEDIKT